MGRVNWPTLSRRRPKDVFEHADALKHDFQALHEHVKMVKANKRHLAKLPSGYTTKIREGISQGLTEAIDNEYYPKFISDIDRDLFCKTLLRAIRSELTTEAHDRIPLLQFDTLHSSYKHLFKKLTSNLAPDSRTRHMTPESDLEQNRVHGSLPLTSCTINQAAVPDFNPEEDDMDLEIDEEASDLLRTLRTIEDQGTILSHQLELLEGHTEDQGVPEFAVGHGRNPIDNGEEVPEGAQAEEREKEKEIHDSAIVRYGACNTNPVETFPNLRDDDWDTNAIRDFDRDKGPKKTKKYGHPRKEETRNTQSVATVNNVFAAAFSKFVTFEVKHQVTVNRLVLATSQEILEHLYRSLQKIIATYGSLVDFIHLSEPRLVDDGNIMFRADTNSQDFFNPAPISAWEVEFEAGLSHEVPTYKVVWNNIGIKCMNITTRKRKAEVIQKLVGYNKHRLSLLHSDFDIIDLSWIPHAGVQRLASLLIEFTNRQLANEVLQQGYAWKGKIQTCQMVDSASRLTRCSRCQAYGHSMVGCSAPYCCGKCAEAHPTKGCKSRHQQCAACGGQHQAKDNICPVRIAERKKIRFHTPEPTAEHGKGEPVTVRPDVGNAEVVEGSSSTLGLVVPPKDKGIDGERLRLARCGKCQGYGHVAGKCSGRLRCGKCALHHPTWTCKSTFARCALCNGDHTASSTICPARPLEAGKSQQLQKSAMPHMRPLRTSTADPSPVEPKIKIEPQSPSFGAAARPHRTSKKRSMLAQVEELIQVVSKGNSHEMALIKDHLETLETAMRAEGGDILAATPGTRKRRAQEALMSGALQDHFGSPKRIKVEEFLDPTVHNSQA